MRPIIHIFEFSEGVDAQGVALPHAANVTETSVSKQIELNYAWLLNTISAGLTSADGTYTLEMSHEDVAASYKPYSVALTNAAITASFDDDHLSGYWFRVVYTKGTETTGTVSFPIVLKRT